MKTADELAALIVADGCLPMIAGKQPLAPPPQGAPLAPPEREALGFTGPGVTMRYPSADGDVIADYGVQIASVRLPPGPLAPRLDILDRAIRRAVGDVQMQEEAALGGKVKTYLVRLSEERYARISMLVPAAEAAALELHVAGLAAVGFTSPRE